MNANELADYLDNNVEAMLFTEQPYLDQAVTMLRQQQKYINRLHKLCNANGIGVGRNLLTGEVIPFEVNDE